MSLNKQLWLAILLIIALTSVGSLLLSIVTSKNYLEKQLQMKNIDNANALALSVSQLPKDDTTIGLLMSAQFDAGHYRYIGLKDPSGSVMQERSNSNNKTIAPDWFINALTINTYPATASIQDDWQQYGTITLESNIYIAYDELWNVSKYILLLAAVLSLVSGILGSLILRKILQPLRSVILQSEAMKNHQFIHVTPPKTPEFKALVNAMNTLSDFVKSNIFQEVSRLKAQSEAVNSDVISGLMTHDYFTQNLDARLARQNYTGNGVIVVARLLNLAEINKTAGYKNTNLLINQVGQIIKSYTDKIESKLCGRLSGSDFAFFHENCQDSYQITAAIRDLLAEINLQQSDFSELEFIFITLDIATRESTEGLYAEIDALFTQALTIVGAENIARNNIIVITRNANNTDAHNQDLLSMRFREALQNERLDLALFPVLDCKGALIHYECPVRMQLNEGGEWLNAGKFISTAMQLNLIDKIDILVIKQSLKLLQKSQAPLSINIAAASILNTSFLQQTCELLAKNRHVTADICFEVAEENVFKYLNEFRTFCKSVRQYKCKVAIEHFGLEISRLGELHDIGLDFIKIDQSIIRGINSQDSNQTLVSGLCIIAHGIGVRAIAEGVKTIDEISTLKRLGIDGITGPAITEKT